MTDSEEQRICILGMGYVGLTLAVVMAECGHEVVGIEMDERKASMLSEGRSPFFEAGLENRLMAQVRAGTLTFTSDHRHPETGQCSVFVVTVGTPLNEEGTPRMDMVERAVGQVADVMPDRSLVILRSTVKLGTTRRVAEPILAATGKQFDLAYCPERTIEGKAMEELRSLPQIVGGRDERSTWRAAWVFQRITPTTIRVSSLEAAEIIKLLDNSYRDLFFSFGNEVALMCEAAGLDGLEVINAANLGYERTSIARPGLVGGPCLEKDPHILVSSMAEFGAYPSLVAKGRSVNENLPDAVMRLLDRRLQELPVTDLRVAVCGLAYKGRPETDDVRGTPARYLISALRQRWPDAQFLGQDFAVSDTQIQALGLEPVCIDDAFANTDIVVIANNHVDYSRLDLGRLFSRLNPGAIVLDIWDSTGAGASGVVEDRSDVSVYRLGSLTASQRRRA